MTPTLGPLLDEYHAHMTERGYAWNTTRASIATLRSFDQFLAGRPLSDIDRGCVQQHMRSKERQAVRTRRAHLQHIKRFCGWLRETGRVSHDPTRGLIVRVRPPVKPHSGTLTPLVSEYLAFMHGRGFYNDKSVYGIRSRLRMFDTFVRDRPLAELDQAVVEDWFASTVRLSFFTRRAYLDSVKIFCRWLVAEGHLQVSPAEPISAGRKPVLVPRSLEPSQVRAVLAACRTERETATIWLLAGLGLRCIEVSRARWADLNDTTNVLLVHGKGGHERYLPVTPPVLDALEPMRSHHRAPLIPSITHPGEACTSYVVQQLVSKVLYRSGVKRDPWDRVTAHALRHTAANMVLQATGNVAATQQLLGHARIDSTMLYIRRIDIHRLRDVMQHIDYAAQRPTTIRDRGPR